MAENWTKGPWAARWVKDGKKRHLVNIVQDTRPLARILAPLPQWFLDEDLDSDEYRVHAANARLMAAAPDLAVAIMPLVFCDPKSPPPGVAGEDWRAAVGAARDAISKARGQAGG